MQSIVFSWPGLPDYAARCIRAVIDRHPGKVAVIGTRPHVPIKGMENSLGQSIIWIEDRDKCQNWQDLDLSAPDLFFQGGWSSPAFGALGVRCRQNGGKVVCLADNAWRGAIQQILIDPVRHRVFLRREFDGLFVPGQSGLRHAKYMGYSPSSTLSGLLGADPALFSPGQSLTERPKIFLFVGRLEPIKNVLGLVSAFKRFSISHPDWRLRICGSGSQRELIELHPRIQVDEYLQPVEVASVMQEARCLVLPTLREAWGLVVHEAALSGCALALSRSVGSAPDFAEAANSVLFKPGSVDAIESALHKIASWDDEKWNAAQATSIQLASKFGPKAFADSVDRFIDILG